MGFLDRVGAILSSLHLLHFAIIAPVILCFLLVAFGRKGKVILFAFYFLCLFSGFYIDFVESLSTAGRWAVMAASILCLGRFVRRSGGAAELLFLSGVLGVVLLPLSTNPGFGASFILLFLILTGPFALLIAKEAESIADIEALLTGFLLLSVVYILLCMLALPSMSGVGGRLNTINKSAPLMVIVGGLILPLLVWGYLSAQSASLKAYCGVSFIFILSFCVLSSQRTGTLAGLLAILPFFSRVGVRRWMLIFTVGCLLVYILYALLLSLYPEQMAFVEYRYYEKGVTGRGERWQNAITAISEGPILGHGPGGASSLGFGMHNAFLVVWYDLGLVGLLLWLSAILVGVVNCFRLIMVDDEGLRRVGQLCLGWLIASVAAAFFEAKLYSPSNFPIFILVLSLVLAHAGVKIRNGSSIKTGQYVLKAAVT